MVPSGWKIHSISDIAEVKGGKRLPKGYMLQPEPNGHPYIRVADMFDGGVSLDSIQYVPEEAVNAISRYKISTSDIFITVAGTLGIVGIIPEQLDGANLTENADKLTNLKIDQRFLLEMLRSPIVQHHIEAEKTTNAQPKLALTRIKGFKIPVPPSPEQRKIAKILSTWDKAISTTERLIDNSKQQKKALMQQLLTGKKRLLDDSGKPFEGEWEYAQLSDWLIEFKEKSLIQDQHRVYTSSRSGLVPQDEYFGNSRISDRNNIGFHVIPPGHITYRSRSDDGFFTFNLFMNSENGIISHYYPVFTSKGSNPFFVSLFEQYRSIFGKYSVGTSQKVLSFNALKAISLRIPSKEEQLKIASVVANADKEIELLEQQLADLKQEKKALMQQLLTGKRRVKVDDEAVA